MSLMISVRDSVVVLELTGAVDVGASPALQSALNDAIKAGFVRLIVDVSRVTVLTADAIGLLVAARRRLDALEGSLTVIGAHDLLRTEFEVTGLAGVLDTGHERDRAAPQGC